MGSFGQLSFWRNYGGKMLNQWNQKVNIYRKPFQNSQEHYYSQNDTTINLFPSPAISIFVLESHSLHFKNYPKLSETDRLF